MTAPTPLPPPPAPPRTTTDGEPLYRLAPAESSALMVLKRKIAARQSLRSCPRRHVDETMCPGNLQPIDPAGVPYDPIVLRAGSAAGWDRVLAEGRCDHCHYTAMWYLVPHASDE